MSSSFSRRRALKTAAAGTGLAFFGPFKYISYAQGKKPIKLGLTCDASGQYGDSGQDDMRGMIIAIEEFNAKGGVLGRQIIWITQDTETTPATGSRVAERFITREECGFLVGALHSGVANAISQVAQKYGCIYFNSNSSSPTEAGKDCHRTKFVWDGNGTNFSKATVKNAIVERRQELAAADQRLRVGPQHVESDARRDRGQRRQGHRRTARAAEHARLHRLPAQDAASQAGRRRGGDRRRRHQGAAHAGRAIEARQQAGVDQQPAGLARRLGTGRR